MHIFTLQTKDPATYCLPSPSLLRIHHRFAALLHLFFVEERIAEGWPRPPLGQFSHRHIVHRHVSGETEDAIAPVHSRQHQTFFTHADLHPSNLLIAGGRLWGIVDWECAGFFPEYWEYTKAMFGVCGDGPIEEIWRRAFDDSNKHEAELRAEQLLWKETPFGL